MTFRITGPGLYVNRRGEKVEIIEPRNSRRYPFESRISSYEANGKESGGETDEDIVGVWEINQSCPTESEVAYLIEEHEKMAQEYDLTKVSERFRALEDGRKLSWGKSGCEYYAVPSHGVTCQQLLNNDHPWSLVPKKRTVTTKLWVYETPNGLMWKIRGVASACERTCLGAIEGSEETTEVEVEG